MTTTSSRPDGVDSDQEAVAICRDIRREYRRGASKSSFLRRTRNATPSVTAVADVSFNVYPGEILGISGPSGSGKSTLLHLLAALDIPTTGTVEIVGREICDLSERQRTRLRLNHVGIVFQRFYLLASLSARANVALPLIERGVGKKARREHASNLLERVGLGDRVTHRPGELSGGEQQRVAIARALANDPDILLADEPTGELDSETGQRILDLFTEFAEGRAVVVASHDQQVLATADRLLRLRDGRLIDEELSGDDG